MRQGILTNDTTAYSILLQNRSLIVLFAIYTSPKLYCQSVVSSRLSTYCVNISVIILCYSTFTIMHILLKYVILLTYFIENNRLCAKFIILHAKFSIFFSIYFVKYTQFHCHSLLKCFVL